MTKLQKIELINQLEVKLEIARRQFFTQESHKIDKNLVSDIISIYFSLDNEDRNKYMEEIYIVFRERLSEMFMENNYKEMIKYFELLSNCSRYNLESPDNKSQILDIGTFGYQLATLETKRNYVKQAHDLVEELKIIPANQISNQTLHNKVVAIDKALNNNNNTKFKTVVEFSLPLSLKKNSAGKLIVNFDNERAVVEYKAISNNAYKEKDMDGQSTTTVWRIIFNSYVSNEIEDKDIPSLLDEKLTIILNKIIQHYRIVTGDEWVRKIYPNMITQKKIIYYVGKVEIRNILLIDNSTYTLTQTPLTVNLGNLVRNDYKLYEQLLTNAKSFLYSYSLRESILALNSSFENYIYEVVCPHIVKSSNGELEDEFYRKILPYENYFLKDYISEEQYNNAIKNGKIHPEVMSTYKIIKYLYKYDKNIKRKYSKTKCIRLIGKIRKNRNDLIHGNRNISLTYQEVLEQINSFEKFMSLFMNVIAL